MSGHSKWNNIKRKKEKTDGARAKVFTKIGREISVAVRDGGPNPASNSKLADLIAILTFPADIAKISDRHRDVPGCAHVRSAVHWMLANAASPRECALGLVLHLPPRCGGYGLPRPSFNEPINLAEANKKLADRSYYVADLLWQTQQLIVEYDSDTFHLTSASHHHDVAGIRFLASL